MKGFKEFITEAKLSPEVEKKLSRYADEVHAGADPDLPKSGNYRYAAALDHVSDRLHDKFHKEHPEAAGHFKRIAKAVVSRYEDNDTAKSKANEKRANKPPKEPKAPKPVKTKTWDQEKPFTRFKKGIGSY